MAKSNQQTRTRAHERHGGCAMMLLKIWGMSAIVTVGRKCLPSVNPQAFAVANNHCSMTVYRRLAERIMLPAASGLPESGQVIVIILCNNLGMGKAWGHVFVLELVSFDSLSWTKFSRTYKCFCVGSTWNLLLTNSKSACCDLKDPQNPSFQGRRQSNCLDDWNLLWVESLHHLTQPASKLRTINFIEGNPNMIQAMTWNAQHLCDINTINNKPYKPS